MLDDTREPLRQQMPITQSWAFFDHSSVAALSAPASAAVGKWCHQATYEGNDLWPTWHSEVERTRQLAASMLGATEDLVALMPSTTAGINLVAEGLDWRDGDNLVTLANEFPSNLYPWMHLADLGVETRQVAVCQDGRVDLARLAEACDQRTRLVSVSWVSYCTGWRLNLDDLATMVHDRGALLFLDAIQGLGVFPLNVAKTPIDFLAADGHKWMLGSEGAGLFFASRESLNQLRPVGVGWNSVVDRYQFDQVKLELRSGADRYEGGSLNMAGFLGLAASLQMLHDWGLGPDQSRVADWVLEIADYAAQQLVAAGARIINPRPAAHRSGIVVFDVPGVAPESVRKAARRAQVALSCRGGGVRISPHAYNDQRDVERLIAVVKRVAGNSAEA